MPEFNQLPDPDLEKRRLELTYLRILMARAIVTTIGSAIGIIVIALTLLR